MEKKPTKNKKNAPKNDSGKSSPKKPSAKKPEHKKKDFLVVGLGASAGGVKALQEFFASMPADSGMAFVVILHLSPNHESNLDQILQARTRMPVIQVNETHKVEPNHVYVIPPNKHLEMVDGVVRLTQKEHLPGNRAAIDVFFRTMAEAYKKNAVCVVLSGTGSDGTLGLKRVKESNGFAVVQSPEDAEYDQMPRSAIATNLADWILPIAQMPEKLIHFKESSERLHLTNGADPEKVAREINAEGSLREILTVLRVRTGHDFSNYKTPTLVRRIARHIQIHELEDLPTYLNFLRDNPEEVLSLQRNLLINVTNFFRDKAAFDALERAVIPKLFTGRTARDTVRVWSAGCASGEESYSLAMLLSEYATTLSDPPKFQIFATDVDDEAIGEAREHSYSEAIEQDVSPERLKRFFTKEGKRYRVKKELRETILFAPHNILRDPPFSRLDLVVCRNLLIYLNRDTQERVMEIFHFALSLGGYLFLGGSETAENSSDLFDTIDKKQRIYQRRATHLNQRLNAPAMPLTGSWRATMPDRKTIRERNKSFSLSEVHYKLLEKFAPPSVIVNREFDVLYMSETVGRYLRFSGGEMSNNILKLVLPELLPDLRAALFTAQRERQSSEFPNIHLNIDGEDSTINLIVRTFDVADTEPDLMLVVFEEIGKSLRLPDFLEDDGADENQTVQILDKGEAMEKVVRRLEEDLQRTRSHLRSTIEQHEVSIEELKASNEELQAINEELRSASEELETSKEELQSVNEELTTVNSELKEKIDETSRTNSDLQNLMAATDIATIFLDRNLRIKRYTPPTEEIFNVTKNDIGRPLAHFTHRLDYPDIAADAEKVLKTLKTVEREIANGDDRFFMTRFAPYRTLDDRINGVVLNFIDITERKRAEEIHAADLRDTQILHELSTRLVSEENSQKIYDEIMTAAVRLTNAAAGTVQIYDAPTQKLHLLATSGFKRKMTEHFAVVDADSKTSCGIALKNGERTFIDFDDPQAADIDGSMQMHVEAGYLSAQSTPLVARAGKPIGMVSTHWKESGHRPTTRELRFLDLLARQAADLIEQRRAEEKLRRAAELDAFRVKLADVLRPLADPIEIQESVGLTAMKFFDADRCYYCEAENGTAIIRRDARRKGLPSVAGEYPLESLPLFSLTMKKGRALVVDDVRLTDLMDDDLKRLCVEMEIISFINVPVIREKKYVGNLCITNAAARSWTDSEIGIAEEIAERTWAAVERAKSETASRESEERLRIAIGAAQMYSWEYDIEAGTYKFSDNAAEILGVAPERLPQTAEDAFALVHPDDLEIVERELRKALKAGKGFNVEIRSITDAGETVCLHVETAVIKDANKKPARIVGIAQDITARKRAEAAVSKSEERLRIALEAAELGTWDWNIKTDEVVWNEQHFILFGMKPTKARLSSEAFKNHVHPEDRARVEARLRESIETGINFEAEFRAVRDDGAVRWMEGYGHVTETEGGKAVRMSGVMGDITVRRYAAEALHESEERLRHVMESVADYAIITTDLKGIITDWNTGAERIFGFTPKEVIGHPADIIFTPEDRANNVPAKEMTTALVKGRAEDERYHIRKNGSRFYVSGMMTTLKDGRTEGFVKIARDMTGKMEAEKVLQEKETLRRIVASQEDERRRIARDIHDHFGQQITALRMKLDNLKKDGGKRKIADLEEAQKIAAGLDAEVDFIAWELRPVALEDLGLLTALNNFVRDWSHHTKIEIEFHTTGLKKVNLDFETETNLYRIAQEALNNIYKHAGATKVSVLLERRKGEIVLIVEDDGKGFDVRDKANRRKGIGLSGMSERAEILGGDFEIESRKGAGTTVYARVPLAKNDEKK